MKFHFRNLLGAVLALIPVHALADYSQREDVSAFVNEIAQRNGLDRSALFAALSRAHYNPSVIDLIKPPEKRGARSWKRYRERFLTPQHISSGLKAWAQYENELRRAEKQYGVPAEIILGILGVETIYGRNTGNFETLSALATLAFDYPPRAELFRGELEALFLLAREQHQDPASYTGSYAGAIGWPQFLPSSIRRFAVDFDGNGKIDFYSDAVDAIGSVANYLHEYGWVPGAPVAIKAWLTPEADPQPLIDAGIEPALGAEQLAAAGVFPVARTSLTNTDKVSLIDLETHGVGTEYWLGYSNFYTITRYNRSNFYAMSVFQLARALRQAHDGNVQVSVPTRKAKAHKAPVKSKVPVRSKVRKVRPHRR